MQSLNSEKCPKDLRFIWHMCKQKIDLGLVLVLSFISRMGIEASTLHVWQEGVISCSLHTAYSCVWCSTKPWAIFKIFPLTCIYNSDFCLKGSLLTCAAQTDLNYMAIVGYETSIQVLFEITVSVQTLRLIVEEVKATYVCVDGNLRVNCFKLWVEMTRKCNLKLQQHWSCCTNRL